MTNNKERENTYVFDSESSTELARLINQDRITTRTMGGPFSGLIDEEIAGLHSVLDVACGPGGWVLDVAFAYPDIEVAGVDISRKMVDYANARARSQGLSNASFGVMNITQPLDFSADTFDLVNVRFIGGVLSRDAWSPFIAECTRLLKRRGILHLTEAIDWGNSTSPALERLIGLLNQAAWRMGYGFSPDGRTIGTSVVLPHLLRAAEYQNVQYKAHVMDQSADSEFWADSYRHYEVAFALLQPFLVKSGVIEQDELNRLYQQLLIEMHYADFCAMWHFMSAWGVKA